MTERGIEAVARDRTALAIGPSSMTWDGEKLVIDCNEVTVPFPGRLRGRITLRPSALGQVS
ncbi:MAG: hydratase, partial [Pseudomonadota bacterium]